MDLTTILVFVGVFALVALPLVAIARGPSRTTRQALATLDSAIKSEHEDLKQQVLNVRKDEQLSSIPWLNQKLHNLELAPLLSNLLGQANLSWTPGRLLSMSGFCFAITAFVVYLRFNVALPGLLAGLVTGAAPIGYVLFLRSRRFNKFEAGLPEALDLMVSALRAGHSLIAAMGLVARECTEPVKGEFKICFEEQNYGLEMKTALDNLLNRMPIQDLRMVATAIMIQKESGGNLAEVLDKTSHLIRDRFRLKRQVQVHTAQGRMTGWVLTLIPIFLGIAMYFLNPDMMSILWHRDIGIKLMWITAGMIVVGGIIIQRIVDIDV